MFYGFPLRSIPDGPYQARPLTRPQSMQIIHPPGLAAVLAFVGTKMMLGDSWKATSMALGTMNVAFPHDIVSFHKSSIHHPRPGRVVVFFGLVAEVPPASDPPTPLNAIFFFTVSCRPSTKAGGIYHGKPGFAVGGGGVGWGGVGTVLVATSQDWWPLPQSASLLVIFGILGATVGTSDLGRRPKAEDAFCGNPTQRIQVPSG